MSDFEFRQTEGDLGTAIKQMAFISSLEFKTQILQEIAEETIRLVQDGFYSETDPYGKAWAPTKKKSGRILEQFGTLLRSIRSEVREEVFRIIMADYGGVHQVGTKHIPQRMIVPDEGKGLPEKWEQAYEIATEKVINRIFG